MFKQKEADFSLPSTVLQHHLPTAFQKNYVLECENETDNKWTGTQIQLAVCRKTWLLLTFCIIHENTRQLTDFRLMAYT